VRKASPKLGKTKRIHVFYSGRVQGVGFRFTAENVALSLTLMGWVKNLPDGRVEAVVEGEETKLNAFLEKMRQGLMKPYIRKVEVKWEAPQGGFEDFNIRF